MNIIFLLSALCNCSIVIAPGLRTIILPVKSKIVDSIPMAIYRALVWKRNQLEEIGELTKEKARLLKKGKNKKFIGRENYKQELTALVKSKNFGG